MRLSPPVIRVGIDHVPSPCDSLPDISPVGHRADDAVPLVGLGIGAKLVQIAFLGRVDFPGALNVLVLGRTRRVKSWAGGGRKEPAGRGGAPAGRGIVLLLFLIL